MKIMRLLVFALTLMTLPVAGAQVTDRFTDDFNGIKLSVYQGECHNDDFTVQMESRSYRYIGPQGSGTARTAEEAISLACGESEVRGL
jgi:hypothetical protein